MPFNLECAVCLSSSLLSLSHCVSESLNESHSIVRVRRVCPELVSLSFSLSSRCMLCLVNNPVERRIKEKVAKSAQYSDLKAGRGAGDEAQLEAVREILALARQEDPCGLYDVVHVDPSSPASWIIVIAVRHYPVTGSSELNSESLHDNHWHVLSSNCTCSE